MLRLCGMIFIFFAGFLTGCYQVAKAIRDRSTEYFRDYADRLVEIWEKEDKE